MKVSICVTYYNQQEFVKDSLDSILTIDFPCDFEILCGDDGSTDETLTIIKEYVSKYPKNIKYFVMSRDKTQKSINRASSNRLNLAKNASGNYIMFLDGDDFYCDKTFLKEAIDYLENNMNISVYAFNFKILHTDNKEEVFKAMRVGIITASKYIYKGFYTHSGACVFRNILDNEKFDLLTKINNFDDNAITLYMLQFGDLYYTDKPIYIYRQTPNSLWCNINSMEKHLLNAIDYKLICDSAPMFKNEIAKRQYGALKYVYKNKKNLKKELGQKFEKYLLLTQKNEDMFIKNLLLWNELKLFEKIKTFFIWNIIKQKAKLGKLIGKCFL